MRISRVKIENVQQFKDFEVELTYPKGHVKEGQPLDKVCFIGQSGTGKTTLLNLLKEISSINPTSSGYRMETRYAYTEKSELRVDYQVEDLRYSAVASNVVSGDFGFALERPLVKHGDFSYKGNKLNVDSLNFTALHQLDRSLYNRIVSNKVSLINFPLGFRYDKTTNAEGEQYRSVIDYGKQSIWDLWYEMIEALELQKNELTAKVLEALNAKNGERERKMLEVDEWRRENPNMLTQIGEECLNKVLKKFYLEVYDDLTNEKVLNQFRFVPLRHTKTGDLIPYSLLNSASHNVALIATALFFYKPKGAVILIDEVENSLYPDVQEEIASDYINIAPDNQYFFSTHSPLVASSFEPWEIIELKFDEDGNIYQDNYLRDEAKGRHVDNYRFDPKSMSWSSIIARIYDLQKDGPDYRQKKLSDLAAMDEKIKAKKKKGEPVTIEEIDAFVKLGAELDWRK